MMDLGVKYQDKYYSLLRRFQLCSLGDFIFIVNSLGKLGDKIAKDVISLSTNKDSEKYRLLRKAERNMFELKIYEFMNYSKLLKRNSSELFNVYRKKYKAVLAREDGEFMNAISEKVYTQKSLKDLSFTRIEGRIIAKLSFARGISIQVHAENDKLILSSFPW